MKRIIVLLIVSLFVITLSAQNNYLGFNLGTSISKSDFAATENLFSDGYALPGFTIQFDAMYFPIPVVGIGGMLGFGSLYGDRDLYLDGILNYAYTQSTIPIYTAPPLVEDVDFESGFWNYVNLMIGPELALPLGRLQIGVRGMAGLSMNFYPKRDLFYDTGMEELSAVVKGLHISPGYLVGGNLLYQGRSGTGIRVSADYIKSNAAYNFEMNLQDDQTTHTDERDGKIAVETLNITIGLFYSF